VQVLAYIEVFPSPTTVIEKIPDTIPGTRPFYLHPINTVDMVRPEPVCFQNPGKASFQINGKFYDPTVAIEAPLNTAQEWTLDNTQGFNTHPFHIHVNPFQIVDRTIDFEVEDADLVGGKRLPNDPCNWMWSDTVALPIGAQLKIRSRFLVYPGEFVLHCHILVHEDVGMMVNVKVCGENDTTCAPANRGKGKGVGPNQKVTQPTPEAVDCVKRTTKQCSYQ
jgi:FtsP/CotA-like multicopper oxidase with cupredoxin domain